MITSRTRPLLSLGLLCALTAASMLLADTGAPDDENEPVFKVVRAKAVEPREKEEEPPPPPPETFEVPEGPRLAAAIGRKKARPPVEKAVAPPQLAPKPIAFAPSMEEPLDARAISRVMRERMPAFQSCYESALKLNPDLEGRQQIEFTINDRGRVQDAVVAPRDEGPESVAMARCVKGVIMRAAFPSPGPEAITVEHTLKFRSR